MFSPQKIAVVQYDTPHLEVSGVPFLDGVWAEKIVTFLSIFKAVSLTRAIDEPNPVPRPPVAPAGNH